MKIEDIATMSDLELFKRYVIEVKSGTKTDDPVMLALFDEMDKRTCGVEKTDGAINITNKPVVIWNDPIFTPIIPLDSEKTFWVAVLVTRHIQSSNSITTSQIVFDAQYVNRPLEIDSDGEPTNDDHFVSEDGEPVDAVGWHSVKEHSDFNGYYEPLEFSERFVLLGWAEYQVPEFNGVSNER